MIVRFLSPARKRRLAHRLYEWRHRLLDYPLDRIEVDRPRVLDKPSDSPIPHKIVQTYRDTEVPRPIASAVMRWQETNPEFDYRFFDDEATRAFIETHFPREVLAAFDSLVPGAYKADLWRYCYLVEKGGVYVDIRMEPLVALRTMLSLSDSAPPAFVAARDLQRNRPGRKAYVFNAFIAAAPRHPFLIAALDRSVGMIRNRDYGRDPFDITGPGCLGAAVNKTLGRDIAEPIEPGDHDHPAVGRYRILTHDDEATHRNVLAYGDLPLIRTKCVHGPMRRADRRFPQKSYSRMYHKGRVFR